MLFIYRLLTFILFPIFIILMFLRSFFKKEDRKRFKEKIFTSSFSCDRDFNKKLYWFHAASIGELNSIIPLIKKLNNKNIEFLITTVTLSSSLIVKKKLYKYKNIKHRFFPLDAKHLVKSFLKSWNPNLICFIDSEIWPNFISEINKRKIPLALINGRITKKTLNRWKKFPKFAEKIFSSFDLCLASNKESMKNLEELKAKNIKYIGNLKFSVVPEVEKINEQNKKHLDDFRVWCAASTHRGEESICLSAHLELKKKLKNLITIIIPRHIARASEIKKISKNLKLRTQVLNNNELINEEAEILIINSFGVLSNYFSYCKNIFIGKSMIEKLLPVSGQNPIEAAKLGCNIYHGPYTYNFQEIYKLLKSYNISHEIKNSEELKNMLIKNLDNLENNNTKEVELLNAYGQDILKKSTIEIINLASQ